MYSFREEANMKIQAQTLTGHLFTKVSISEEAQGCYSRKFG